MPSHTDTEELGSPESLDGSGGGGRRPEEEMDSMTGRRGAQVKVQEEVGGAAGWGSVHFLGSGRDGGGSCCALWREELACRSA